MNTKFSPLLKIKKGGVDTCEAELVKNSSKIVAIKDEIDKLIEEIYKIEIPQSGTFDKFLALHAVKKSLNDEIDRNHFILSDLKREGEELKREYDIALREYEKIKYLQEQEIKKYIEIMKKRERVELDEITSIIYNTKGRKFNE